MEKIKEELNNLINLHNKKIDIEKLTKNIEEKKKELEKLDNKVKLQIDVQLKNIAQKELETAQKEFEKMQKDKKIKQDELNKKFESHKKNLLLMIDEEIYKELNNLKSSKNAYEKIASNAENTVNRLIKDFNEGKNIDQSMLISARKEIEFNRKKIAQISKKIEEYVVGATNPEQYSDLTYLKMRVKGLYLENLNENTEKDFYEKYFQDKKITEPIKPEDNKSKDDNQTKLDDKNNGEKIEPKDDKTIKPELTEEEQQKIIDENPVYALLADMDALTDYYAKLTYILKDIIELEKNGNNNEIDKKIENANEYFEKVNECKNKIEEMSKNIKFLEKENIKSLNLKQNEEKRYIDEINRLTEEIKSVKFKPLDNGTIKPNEIDNNNEKDGRKIVEEYFAIIEKRAETFKELITTMKFALSYSEQNNNKIKELYELKLSEIDEKNQSIKELTKQLLEMAEKVKPYLGQEEEKIILEYAKQEKENLKRCEELEQEIAKKTKTIEPSNPVSSEKDDKTTKNDTEPNKPNNEENQKDINNLHFYSDLNKLKNIEPVVTFTIDNVKDHNKINYKKSNKWETIREKLRNVYPEINFESEEGQQELKKYENADPNIVKVLSNNKNRLEEYIALLNGEKQIDVNNKDALKITYDIRTLSKSELSKEEKKALEDYAFKHRNIAEVKKTALQSIKFKFREMKEKRENKKAVKALNAGKIVTSPVKEKLSSKAKKSITKAKHKKEENINSMNQDILSDEEKQKMFEEIAKKQNDKFLENTSNWKDTLKVPETPKPIQTKPQEQEKTPEPTINEETRKDEDVDNDEIEFLKWLDLRIKARKKESLNDDKKRKAYSSYVITSDEKMAKSMEKILNESIDVKKDIVKGIKQHKKSLEDKIASMPEGRNKEIYSEAIEIMDKNIQELESIISDDIKKLGEKPNKREGR